ncbi:phage NrS-1 polymerase family protein [Deinococcus aerophilus]|uniref:NrS-1 polymerase-like HBD domain-containing protein n=1 Tax=Deinococcus aerophilus TaxID=522488 RepID=A0ABQ2GW97_9DEIO|nr:hypothetical protein [Deinococcus aerophilus]GGM16521.1 hypothetical protein GCM10010841_26080 [Deinococcus aerophilus]
MTGAAARIARVEAHWPLLDRPRWWLWQARRRAGGGVGKVPVVPVPGGGLRAHDAGDPRAWRPWAAVRADHRAGRGDGVDFALGGGLVCVDLDGCLDAHGVPDATAAALLAALPGYAERSPSGTGLHLFAWAVPGPPGTPEPGNRRAGRLELLRRGLITVTGDVWPGHAGPPSSAAALARVAALEARPPSGPVPPGAGRAALLSPPTDAEVLARLLALRNAPKLARLLAGDLRGYPSPSEADFALARMLRFATQDPGQIQRVMRACALARARWDRPDGAGRSYLQRTVERALALGGPTLPHPPSPPGEPS